VRSALATAAASAGITTKQIMEAADWRSDLFLNNFTTSLVAIRLGKQCCPLLQQILYKHHVDM